MKVLDILSAIGALVLAATPVTAATIAHAQPAARVAVQSAPSTVSTLARR